MYVNGWVYGVCVYKHAWMWGVCMCTRVCVCVCVCVCEILGHLMTIPAWHHLALGAQVTVETVSTFSTHMTLLGRLSPSANFMWPGTAAAAGDAAANPAPSFFLKNPKTFFLLLLEREEGGERNINVRKTLIGCLPYTSRPRIGPTTRDQCVWEQPVPGSALPPTSLDGCGFFSSVVVRFPLDSISDGSEWRSFYILVIILMWLCERVNHVCLCRHLDPGVAFLDKIILGDFSDQGALSWH